MSYQKNGSIKVTFDDGSEHDFTSVETCAGLAPEEVVLKTDVDTAISEDSQNPVENRVIAGALDDKADLENGKVPAEQLPSYVDDVTEYATTSDFPQPGETGKIYVALDTGFTYRWSGSDYIQIAAQDNVETYASTSNFPAEGENNIIYIAEDTNKQYRWNGSAYVMLSPEENVLVHNGLDTLSADEIQAALRGKLIITYGEAADEGSYVFCKNSSGDLMFERYSLLQTSSSRVVSSISIIRRYLTVDSSTGAIRGPYQVGPYTCILDNNNNFIDTATTLDISGKQLIRASNLRKTQDMIANVYDNTATYAVGDYCIYQNQLYKCVTQIDVAEAWDATHWALTNVVDYVKDTEQVGAKIVEINGTGVQTEAMGAEIEEADALVMGSGLYWRFADMNTSIQFKCIHGINIVKYQFTEQMLEYTKSSRELNYVLSIAEVTNKVRVAPKFSTSRSYFVGDLVWNDDSLYMCIIAHTGAWDATHFQQTTIDDAIKAKQDTLISGSNIKTVNGESLLGSGNIEIEGGIEVVNYQTTTPLTSEQIEKARIGKLCVYYNGVMCFYSGGNDYNLGFSGIGIEPNDGSYVPWQTRLYHHQVTLNLTTGMLSEQSSQRACISDVNGNVFDATIAPSENDKRLVRALNLRRTQNMLADEYDATTTYEAGDVAVYQNQLYRCITAIDVAEAWNASHWQLTNMAELVRYEVQQQIASAIGGTY